MGPYIGGNFVDNPRESIQGGTLYQTFGRICFLLTHYCILLLHACDVPNEEEESPVLLCRK